MMNGMVRHDYASTDGGCDFWEMETNKPLVGEKVYFVDVSYKEIWAEEVYAIGKDTFLTKEISLGKTFYKEYRFDDCGFKWYGRFEDAENELYGYLDDDEELVEETDGWYAKRL